MKTSFAKIPRSAKGFTLVELMIAIAIVAIMMLAVVTITGSASDITIGGIKRMDADTEARATLDRMAFDISRMVKRSDVDYYFPSTSGAQSSNGSDVMAFFSETGGYYPGGSGITGSGVYSSSGTGEGGTASLVGYRINLVATDPANAANTTPQLVRLSKGLAWNGVKSNYPAMVFLPVTIVDGPKANTNWPGIADGTSADYQVIGDQIFRMELTYLLQSTTTVPAFTQFSTVPNLEGVTYPPPTGKVYFNPKEVKAIIITIAVLDNRSQKMVQPGILATAATYLSNVTLNPVTIPSNSTTPPTAQTLDLTTLPLYQWQQTLNNSLNPNGGANPPANAAPPYLGLPKLAALQVRFYQRFCYLDQPSQ